MNDNPVRRSERLQNQGKTLLYTKYNSKGEKEYQPNTGGERHAEVVHSHSSSSSDSDSTFQSVGSVAVSETSIDTVVQDHSVVNEISDLMSKMELEDKEYKKLVRKLRSIKSDIVDYLD